MKNKWCSANNNGDNVSPTSHNGANDGRCEKMKKSLNIYKEEQTNDEVCSEIILKEESKPAKDAKPIGDVISISGEGIHQRNHYKAFVFDGNTYQLEDSVLVVPDSMGGIMNPNVAIIKDISETKNGSILLNGQWFYRPEDAEMENGEILQSSDARELFYSFHRGEVPAESVMHKCVVHFLSAEIHIPGYREYPGFIVQKVYDHISKRLFKLTDKTYEDNLQHEVGLLVQKTMCRLGDHDITRGDHAADVEYQLKIGKPVKRKNTLMFDVIIENETTYRFDQLPRAETPESCKSSASEYYIMLADSNALTGNHYRDKWLEKLLEGIVFVCNNNDGTQSGGPTNMSRDNSPNISPAVWPDGAVSAVIALEAASYKSFSSRQKYNQKMRQLCFNIKKSAKLAWRLLKRELEPSKVLTMLPNELKEGLTAEEIASNEPEEDVLVQMTDARCERCTEKKACLVDIFSAGKTDRYQLECTVCGKTWYASRDEASTFRIDAKTHQNPKI